MKFSLDWLRQYVDLPEEGAAVAEHLAAAGFPADSVEAWGADTVLDVDVTTNRPDAMCHTGVARELAARLRRPLRLPTAEPPTAGVPAAELARVEVQDPDLCSRYTALVLTGIQVRPSPDWLQDRLASIGLRPVNNIVDVTNFVLHEMGQPLHAFDLEHLEDARIVVRRASRGEALETLDGTLRQLAADQLVIADGSRAVALAGVMGGAHSEIGTATTRVLLESAHFSPGSIRLTARAMGMHTDASHRFERGCDQGITLDAANRAAGLILETAGGSLHPGVLEARAPDRPPGPIRLATAHVERLLGMAVPAAEAAEALTALGFQVQSQEEVMEVSVPSRRVDVQRPEDLIEEIARFRGYDSIPATVPAFLPAAAGSRPTARLDRARRFMAGAGFLEALCFPMADPLAQTPFMAAGQRPVHLDNPLTQQMSLLRVSLLPGLLESLARNRNRGAEAVRLFEIGRLFQETDREDGLPLETTALAAATCGSRRPGHWSGPERPTDFFDIKGLLQDLGHALAGLRYRVEAAPAAPAWLDPQEAGRIWVDESPRGWVGRLAPERLHAYDVEGPVQVMELDLCDLPLEVPVTQHTPLPRHPPVERDLALLVTRQESYAHLESVIREAGGSLLESIALFDHYAGRQAGPDRVSLGVRLRFRHADRTLTAEEVGEVQGEIVARLQREAGAELRDA